MENKPKLNTILLVIIIILLATGLSYYFLNNSQQKKENQILVSDTKYDVDQSELNSDTVTYQNHGFTIEFPKEFIPHEEQAENGPAIIISLPIGGLSYVQDSSFWEKNVIPNYTYIENKMIGGTIFKTYIYSGTSFYWFKQGKIGYEFGVNLKDKTKLENLLKTFKFIGWSQEQNAKTLPVDLEVVKKSPGNPSASSDNRFVIIATHNRGNSENLTCGKGNEFVDKCYFYIEKSSGEILKIGEWPTEDLVLRLPNKFIGNGPNFFNKTKSLIFSSKEQISFDSEIEYGCSTQGIQHWMFDIVTNEIILQKEEITHLDGC